MAGTLPDLPGHRFRVDKDGTLYFAVHASGALEDKTSALSELMNFDGNSTYSLVDNGNGYTNHYFLFPEARNITAAVGFVKPGNGTTTQWAYSTNTVTGTDGTWTNFVGTGSATGFDSTWRVGLNTVNLANVKGLRFQTGAVSQGTPAPLTEVAIYGFLPTTTERLAFWSPTTDVQLTAAALDFGDVPNNTTGTTKTFRVKNLSSTKTATGVHVVWDPADQVTAAYALSSVEFSFDQEEWAVDVEIGNIAASSISPVIYARPVVPAAVEFIPRTAWVKTTNTGFVA